MITSTENIQVKSKMTELKRSAKESAQNLRTLESKLKSSFSPVEDETLSRQLDAPEVNAHKFLVRIVDTQSGTISEVVHMFNMCVDAHEKNGEKFASLERRISDVYERQADIIAMVTAIKREQASLKADYEGLNGLVGVVKILWSTKAIAISIISAMALAGYKVYSGDWG